MTTAAVRARTNAPDFSPHVFKEDLLGLFPRGQIDYKKIAEIAHLSKEDLGKLGKVAKSTVRFDGKIPPAVADRLKEIANIANLVAEYFNGDAHKVSLWFTLPNPLLGKVSPRDMLRISRYDRLLNFVIEARNAERAAQASKLR
jgi:hypothetical protein